MTIRLECSDCGRTGCYSNEFRSARYDPSVIEVELKIPNGWRTYHGQRQVRVDDYAIRVVDEDSAIRCGRCTREYEKSMEPHDAAIVKASLAEKAVESPRGSLPGPPNPPPPPNPKPVA